MISQGDQKSEQKKQKEVEKIVASKDEEITHLKNHSQDLIAHIKKLKREKKIARINPREIPPKGSESPQYIQKEYIRKKLRKFSLKTFESKVDWTNKKIKKWEVRKILRVIINL